MDFISPPLPFSSPDPFLFPFLVYLQYFTLWSCIIEQTGLDLMSVLLCFITFLAPRIISFISFTLSSAVRPFDTFRPKSGPAGPPPGAAWASRSETKAENGVCCLQCAVCGCWWQQGVVQVWKIASSTTSSNPHIRLSCHFVHKHKSYICSYGCMSRSLFGRGW